MRTVTIADYGPGCTLRNRAEAEAYASHYTPGTRLYVPYAGKTPKGILSIYALTIKSVQIEEDKGRPGTGKITAGCSDRKPYTRKAHDGTTAR